MIKEIAKANHDAAHAFAAHLRDPGTLTARVLADRLDTLGDRLLAKLLRGFADRGRHQVPAEWWPTGSLCRLDLQAPTHGADVGDLWFDPLEVTVSLVVPWLPQPDDPPAEAPTVTSWVALAPVTAWQLLGAGLVDSGIGSATTGLTGEQACAYADLFAKTPAGSMTWLLLKRAYGMGAVRQLWGADIPVQFGSGGTISGSLEHLTVEEIEGWELAESRQVREISAFAEAGFGFRTWVPGWGGLWEGEGSITRNWRS